MSQHPGFPYLPDCVSVYFDPQMYCYKFTLHKYIGNIKYNYVNSISGHVVETGVNTEAIVMQHVESLYLMHEQDIMNNYFQPPMNKPALGVAGPLGIQPEWYPGPPEGVTGPIDGQHAPMNALESMISGLKDKVTVGYPCTCDHSFDPVKEVIIHLNDSHGEARLANTDDIWSRERIADWLDELHTSGIIDLSVTVPEDGKPLRLR